MQYIFGDNRSSYAVIYTDGTVAEAQKQNSLLRFSIVPNEKYNTLGYLTYGSNSGNSMFFCIKKDKSIPRSCYFTHAFTREADEEKYLNGAMLNDIFAEFIDQDSFDALRDGNGGDVKIGFNESLAAADKSVINPDVLHEALVSLYQKNKVLLVIDDEKYSDDLARCVIKEIFKNLTPSLRKAVAYLTAVVDIGNVEVLLRVVPKSMVADVREPYMNIDGSDLKPRAEKNLYDDFVSFMIQNAKAVFKSYEALMCGFSSTYKKQNTEDFFVACNDLKRLEKIIDSYLVKVYPETKDQIVKFGQRLSELYNNQAEIEARFQFSPADVFNPANILANNSLFIYKVMLFSNEEVGRKYITGVVTKACADLVISPENADAVENAIKAVEAGMRNGGLKIYEKYFYNELVGLIYTKFLAKRHNTYTRMRQNVETMVPKHLGAYGPIEPSELKEVKSKLISNVNETLANVSEGDANISIENFVEEYITKSMKEHNDKLMLGGNGVEGKYPNEVVLNTLAEIESELAASNNLSKAGELLKTAIKFQKEYHFMVNSLVAKFVIKGYGTQQYKETQSIVKVLPVDAQRLNAITKSIVACDSGAGCAFILRSYPDVSSAIQEVLAVIAANKAVINVFSVYKLNDYIGVICKALNKRVKPDSENLAPVTELLKGAMESYDKNSNVYKLLGAMKDSAKTGSAKPVATKAEKNKGLIAVGAIAVAVIAIVLAVLFALDVFGGKDGDNGDESSVISAESSENTSGLPEGGSESTTAGNSESTGNPESGAGTSESTGTAESESGTGTSESTDNTESEGGAGTSESSATSEGEGSADISESTGNTEGGNEGEPPVVS